MSVSNGEEVNATVSNAAWVSRKVDTDTIGKLALKNTATGADITNTQDILIDTMSTLGFSEGDSNQRTYATNNYVTNGDTYKECIETFDVQVKSNTDNISSNDTDISDHETRITTVENDYGSANGLATLDGSGKVPLTQVPTSILVYQGTWNATTNTPTLANGTGAQGYWYRVSVAGSQDLGSGSISYNVDDKIVHNGTIWQKWDTTDNVDSVFGRTGDVVAQSGDYTATQVGLGNVTNDAQLKRVAGDINTFTEKITPVDNDLVIIEDSADSYNKKKLKLANMIGGGDGGSGGINYMTGNNSNFETGVGEHVTYKDTAGEIPVDGTGGTPTQIVLSRDTVTPLRGLASAQLGKNAANAQGEGSSCAFTIDDIDQAQMMHCKLEIDASNSNYVDGDLRVFIYDITNSNLIRVSYGEEIAGGKGYHYFGFQTAYNSLSYRWIIHQATTNALSYTIKYDTIEIGPGSIAYGTPSTDWETYTATLTNLGNATQGLEWRRDATDLLIKGRITIGSTLPTGNLIFSLPSGLVMGGGASINLGTASASVGASPYFPIGSLIKVTSTTIGILTVGANAQWNATNPKTWIAGEYLDVEVRTKIAGWELSTKMSEDFGNQDVNSIADGNSGETIVANTTDIPFVGRNDTTGSWDGSKFTANSKMTVQLEGCTVFSSSVLTGMELYLNGAQKKRISLYSTAADHPFSSIIDLEKDDYISIRSIAGGTLFNNAIRHHLQIKKFANPQTIFESEKYYAQYSTDAGQSIGTSATIVNFEDKSRDDSGAVTTGAAWKYTNSKNSIVRIKGTLRLASITLTTTQRVVVDLYKNGSFYCQLDVVYGNGSAILPAIIINADMPLDKDDYFDVRADSSIAGNLTTTAQHNRITIYN